MKDLQECLAEVRGKGLEPDTIVMSFDIAPNNLGPREISWDCDAGIANGQDYCTMRLRLTYLEPDPDE